MPRRGKGRANRLRSERSQAVTPPVSPPSIMIKDEITDIQSIPDANDDFWELPPPSPYEHEIEAEPKFESESESEYYYSPQQPSPPFYEPVETSPELRIRGIAALDETDSEIQDLRQELHHVMRKRRVAHLRNCIWRERQFLQAETTQFTATRAKKRQRSESISSVVSVRPARPPLEYRYRGRSIQEFKTYMTRMEAHFYHHAGYYVDDARKVQEGVTTLSEEMRKQWDAHSDTLGPDRYTWLEFYGFFLDLLLSHPKRMQVATSKYYSARQRKAQSVRDFARYLARLEAEHPGRIAERQKIENIRSRVLEEIGRESRTYSWEPSTYEAFVSHLVMVEITIPERRAVLRGKLAHPDRV